MAKFDIAASEEKLGRIQAALNRREGENLSDLATLSTKGVRRLPEENLEKGYRQAFSVDVDRILHSRA